MPEAVTLERISTIFSGFHQVRKSELKNLENEQEPLFRAVGLKGAHPVGFVDDTVLEYVDPRKLSDVEKAKLQEGDLLMAVRGSLLKVVIVEENKEGLFASSNLTVIRPDREIVDPFFLLGWFQNYLKSGAAHSLRRSSTGQWSITNKDLAALRVALPGLEQQHAIAQKIRSFIHLRKSQLEIQRQYELVHDAYLQSEFDETLRI